MNDQVKKIFRLSNVKEEDYITFYNFLLIWIGLQNIVNFDVDKEYLNDIPKSGKQKECNDILVMEDCKKNSNCKVFKDFCEPKEYIKTFNVGSYIQNYLDNNIYKIIFIDEEYQYRTTSSSSKSVFLIHEENKIGIFIFNFGTVSTDDLFTINFYISKITQFKVEYNLDKILLCGHSYGGYLVQHIALEMKSLDNIFLISSGVYPWFTTEEPFTDDTEYTTWDFTTDLTHEPFVENSKKLDEKIKKFKDKTYGKLLNFGTKKDIYIDSILLYNYIEPQINITMLEMEDRNIIISNYEYNDHTKQDKDLHEWSIYKQYLLLLVEFKFKVKRDSILLYNLDDLKTIEDITKIKHITLKKFNGKIEKNVLPRSLKTLNLGDFFLDVKHIKKENLPTSLEKIDLGLGFYYEGIKEDIPKFLIKNKEDKTSYLIK